MDIDAVFLPVAEELIDDVSSPRRSSISRLSNPTYDPATGQTVPNVTEYSINAGILSSGRNEQGGIGEDYEMRLWIHHGARGLPVLPQTSDRVFYREKYWKVFKIDPTYHSDDLIASKILVRAE